MLRPVLRPSRAYAIASTSPGRIDRRADWTRLDESDAPLGETALEILTCTKDPGRAGLVKNHGHAWIRLWRTAQDYVSLGFYPDESTGIDPEDRPGLRMPGMILTPDKYDRVDWPRRATKVPISHAQYRALVAWLEQAQANRFQGSLAFDLVDRNCVGFVVQAAVLCGVRVEADQTLLGFVPLPIAAPAWLDRITRSIRAPFYRLGIALFGGRAVVSTQFLRGADGPEARQVQGIVPIFQRVSDVLKPLPFYHVRALQAWQDAQADRIQSQAPRTALHEAPS